MFFCTILNENYSNAFHKILLRNITLAHVLRKPHRFDKLVEIHLNNLTNYNLLHCQCTEITFFAQPSNIKYKNEIFLLQGTLPYFHSSSPENNLTVNITQ